MEYEKNWVVTSDSMEWSKARWREALEVFEGHIIKSTKAGRLIVLDDGNQITFVPNEERYLRGRRGHILCSERFNKVLERYKETGKLTEE